MMRVLPALVIFALVQGCSTRGAGQRDADWDREAIDAKEVVREQNVALPPYPQDADLIEFDAAAGGSHRYFIDAKTLDVGADGAVRYALVVKAAGGASNTSYEGIRCKTREKRIYALGHPQRKWIAAKRSTWEPIQIGRANEHQAVLYSEYLCPDRAVVANRETAVRTFRNRLYGDGPRE